MCAASSSADALARNMERDPTIVVLGEDIHRLKGGVSGATRGALERAHANLRDHVEPVGID